MQEKEWFERSQKDFKEMQAKKSFTTKDEGKLLAELTGLLGWFNLDQERKVKILIEEMLIFGEKKEWSMAGPRTAFEHLKKKHQIK
ncbi:hypothetical protein ACFLZB_02685 [Nanoarchaeota archaeon]